MERPRIVQPIDETETQGHRVMWKFQSDPEATFKRMWESMEIMRNPKKKQLGPAQEIVRHINEGR